MTDHLSRRDLVNEAQRLAGDLVGTHRIDTAVMPLSETTALERTPEGSALFER
jgi:hypothetical protein